MELIDHLLQAVDKYGFATAVAVALLVLICLAAKWFGREFVIPVREGILKYLADMTTWNRSLGERIEKFQVEYAEHHAWEQERIARTDDKLDRILDKVTRRLPRPQTDHGE